MKVLMWRSTTDDKDSCYYVYKEAKRQGFDVMCGGNRNDTAEIKELIKHFEPDIIFTYALNKKLSHFYRCLINNGTKIVLSHHDQVERYKQYIISSMKGCFTAGIFSTIQAAKIYRKWLNDTVWIPQYFDYESCKPIYNRDNLVFDLIFLSFIPDQLREDYLRKLEKRYYIYKSNNCILKNMSRAYSISKIAINMPRGSITLNKDGEFIMSNRIFNAMGSGCFFLTHDVPGLDIHFKKKYHLDTYDGTIEDMISKIDFYLENESLRESIAMNGKLHIMQNHSLSIRVHQYWKYLEKIMKGEYYEGINLAC